MSLVNWGGCQEITTEEKIARSERMSQETAMRDEQISAYFNGCANNERAEKLHKNTQKAVEKMEYKELKKNAEEMRQMNFEKTQAKAQQQKNAETEIDAQRARKAKLDAENEELRRQMGL